MRYSAEFTAQAWVNKYAISVDPEGDTVWDCTEFVKAKFADYEISAMLADNTGNLCQDHLKDDPNAPEWVRNWSGPFEVQLIPNVG